MTLEARLARALLEEHPADAALVLERMPPDRRAAVVRQAASSVAPALGEMTPSAVAESITRLEPADAARALDPLALDRALAILRRLPQDAVERTIQGLADEKQELLRRVLRFPRGTAGALMDPVVPELPADITVSEARVRLRRATHTPLLHYIFVIERTRVLAGVLDVSVLLRGGPRTPIRNLMIQRVQHVPAWMPAAAVRAHPGWEVAHVLPVTDEEGRLLGAIRYETLRRIERDADARRGAQGTAETAGALGELFRIGLAGLIEGVAAAAAPRAMSATPSGSGGEPTR